MSILPPVDAKLHLFTSHSWNYGRRREGLHVLLEPWVRGLDFEDYSISRAHPLNTDTDPELARELRDIIRQMDALLILAGMYANNSRWMQFEIDIAFAFEVPIIPILANGQVRVPRLPTRLASCEPVRWRGESIRNALLSCVSPERRQSIEIYVGLRIAKEAEQRRAALAARRLTGADLRRPRWPTPTGNALIDDFASPSVIPESFHSHLLRRR